MKKSALFACLLAAFLLLPVFSAFAQNGEQLFQIPPDPYGGLGKPADPIPLMEGLRTGVLPNGLRYYILENSLPADRAYLTLAVNAGSVLETESERGLAHFTEHLAFNGTARFPEKELIDYLRSLGMRFGPEVNAYTSYDQTVYGIETPTEEDDEGVKRIPDRALAIIDDWTYAVTFAKKDVDDERLVVMEEYRSRLGADERVREKILPIIFRGSRYADRLPIGLPEVIQKAPPSRIENFYKKWYRPDNMAVILVGDFDPIVAEKELEAHFTAPRADSRLVRPYFELPGPVSGNTAAHIIADPELSYSTAYFYFKRTAKEQEATLRGYRESVIDYLISSMINVRTQDAASDGDNPYMAAGSWESRYGRASRYFVMAAQSKAGLVGDTVQAMLTEKEYLIRYGFGEDELERAKSSLVSFLEFQVQEKDRRESSYFIDNFTTDFLEGSVTPDVDIELYAVQNLLPAITLAAVNAAVKLYFADDDLTILLAIPESEDAPTEEELLTMAAEIKNADIAELQRREEKPSLVDGRPDAGAIVEETFDESGAVIWKLNNGATVILKETKNRNSEVSLYGLAKGGESSVPLEYDISAYLASEMENASGAGDLTRADLNKILSSKQLNFSFSSDTYTRNYNAESSAKDLESLFQLLYLSFTKPRIDDNGFSLVLQNRRTRLIQEKDDPDMIFSKELTRMMYSNHPRFKPIELEDLDKVDKAASLEYLRRCRNPSDWTFVFAGSMGASPTVSYQVMKDYVETWIASIPQLDEDAFSAWADPGVTRPGKTEKTINAGTEAKSSVYMAWFSKLPWTEKNNAATLVLDNYLDIILNDEIRENRGGTYSIWENISLVFAPEGELSLGVYFICDPGRAGELRQAVKDGLAAIASPGGIDEKIFVKAKEALLKGFQSNMENNIFVARNLANFSVVQRVPLSHLPQRPELYNSVAAEEIRAIAAKILEDGAGPAELILLPK